MKCGARVALGVAGGYFLGRTKKMKLALMLGGMAAGQRAGGPGELLARGGKLLSASPELSALTGQVRGRLLEAGKGAALAVAARQVESLTDRVGQRVESLGDIGSGRRKSRKSRNDVEDDGPDELDDDIEPGPAAADDADQDEPDAGADTDADTDGDEPAPRRRRTATSAAGRARKSAGATATKQSSSSTSAVRRTAGKAAAGGKARRSAPARRSDRDG